MNISTLSKKEDVSKRPTVSIIGIIKEPIPQSIPIPEITQMNAAVVRPITLSSCFIITPPPKKPIPVTIVESIRVGSDRPKYLAAKKDEIVNIQDPTQIRIIVLNPATLFFDSLSHPTMDPQIVAIKIFGKTK